MKTQPAIFRAGVLGAWVAIVAICSHLTTLSYRNMLTTAPHLAAEVFSALIPIVAVGGDRAALL